MGKNYDLVKAVKGVALVLTFVILLNFAISFYSVSAMSKQTLQISNQSFRKEVQEIASSLNSIYDNMVLEIAYDTDLDKMENSKSTITTITGQKRIKNTLAEWGSFYKMQANFVIYIPASETIINSCKTEGEYDSWRKIKESMLSYVMEDGGHVGWQITSMQGEQYLICVKRYNARYIFCWIELKEIEDVFTTVNYGNQFYVALSDMENNPYTNADKLNSDQIDLAKYMDTESSLNPLKGFIFLSEPVGEYFKVHMMIRNYRNVFTLLRVQIILALILLFVMAFAVWILIMIYRTLLKPIRQFTDNVDRLLVDDSYSVDTHYQVNELGKASRLLEDLINKINKLKINIYEQTLEQQKVKMDFLSLQIEPHFYLNCLNIIYNMAQLGKDEEIQQLAKSTSAYLRYIFRSGERFVPFEEELSHIKNYLEIQEIRYKGKFQTRLEVEEEILGSWIPPLVLQTFVENTIKHAMSWNQEIIITMNGYQTSRSGKKMITFVIEDNGEGFEKGILEKLQKGENISEGDKRIGVMNVIQRLQLAFKEESEILFYNRESGGAGVKITIPFIYGKGEETAYELEHECIIGG